MITGKDILRELQGDYSMYMIIVIVFAAIAAFCTIFCGTQLGWSHLFTIIGFVMCGISVAGFAVLIVRLIKVRSYKLFKKYGSAESIAEKINEGMRSPNFQGNSLLITDRFIVNEGRYSDYLEIKDIVSVRPALNRDVNIVYVGGNVVTTAAQTAAAHYINKKYRDAKGITADNRFDHLNVVDTDGVNHYYSVHRSDLDRVLQTLAEIAPNAEIITS